MKKKNSKLKSDFLPIFNYIDEAKKEIISEILSQTASKEELGNLHSAVDAYVK